MQEHRQRQASVGHTPTHFGHMIKLFKCFFFEVDAPNVNVIVKERHTS
jgi:hypothetical protein